MKLAITVLSMIGLFGFLLTHPLQTGRALSKTTRHVLALGGIIDKVSQHMSFTLLIYLV